MKKPSKQRVDYDEIAHLYDEPLRDHEVDSYLISFLNERSDLSPSKISILDIGCGTGKQLSANRRHLREMNMVGLDLFEGMLNQAKKRCKTIDWVRADGGKLPFHPNNFDYITNQFSYPHIQQKERMITEIHRVLKTGGQFVMKNIDPWSMEGWIIYRYFPEAKDLDYGDFLPVPNFVTLMETVGFIDVQTNRDDRSAQEDLSDFLEFVLQRFRASQLMAISESAYHEGIRRIKEDLENASGPKTPVDSEFCLVTVSGMKPKVG